MASASVSPVALDESFVKIEQDMAQVCALATQIISYDHQS
jgi:hypothetical protein